MHDVLVVGLGNVLLTDDGVGIAAVHRLEQEWELPAGVEALDGGTLGLSLLPYIAEARHLILLDAVRTGATPGSVVRISGDDVAPVVATRLSPHQVGVKDLLDGASLIEKQPGRVLLLGVEPERIGLGIDRTPVVEAAIAPLLDELVLELARLGYPPEKRRTRGESADAARALGL
jgi:hydrogenase maturation protease